MTTLLVTWLWGTCTNILRILFLMLRFILVHISKVTTEKSVCAFYEQTISRSQIVKIIIVTVTASIFVGHFVNSISTKSDYDLRRYRYPLFE